MPLLVGHWFCINYCFVSVYEGILFQMCGYLCTTVKKTRVFEDLRDILLLKIDSFNICHNNTLPSLLVRYMIHLAPKK